jgi:hypothetical protein
MTREPLLASLDLLEIHHLKNVLEAAGIRCWIRNELLARLAGEVPFTECALELHVVSDSDLPRAQALLEVWRRPSDAGPPWRCPACGESIEGQFGACWKCGASRAA